ncbi:LytR/AlgR family response regulator transcription factor [Runella salmonicolor]|uniref:LytTR family DNA-binding domain-containing protein n=1 Tax=Runella salmonicolor TaxID=2950278 RepID=A0ABT1FXP2_9BACT|nr:LytTR family DNA-binding domain-containing protein [Runella salmonicolor]MCP1386541.1 LytTR family DNA-binding domain-containing protein [Runella salmonicolor]
MNNLSVLVIDDDTEHAEYLVEYLSQIQALSHIKVTQSPQEGMKELLQTHYDLLFLDMHMPEITGIELLKSLSLPPTIVVTAHPSFALECFDIDTVVDFIEKPVTLIRLTRAVQRATQEISPMLPKALFLKVGHKMQQFNIDDILYIEADGIYCKIHTKSEVTLANINISDIEKKLSNTNLVRLHKSFIYNLTRITSFDNRHLWIDKQRFSLGVQYRGKLSQILNAKPAE